MFKRILVCLDGSKLSEQVIPYAAEEGSRFGGRLILAQVIAPVTIAPDGGVGAAELLAARREAEVAARSYLERVAEGLRQSQGLDVETVVLEGVPGETIAAYAEEKNVGLIAIATHGEGGVRRLVFGSTADFILRSSHKPILLVRPKA